MKNPFREGEDRSVRPAACAVVIFGATGDLTARKLLPALYELAADDYLAPAFLVIGSARSRLTDAEFRSRVRESIKSHARRGFREEVWDRFERSLYYEPVDGRKLEDVKRLKARLDELTAERGERFNYLYYLATGASAFADIAEHLREAGLIETGRSAVKRTSVVVEKPFGSDLESAQKLNRLLAENLKEEQVFRIDHYLGKETVQNILALRFANAIFEPLWNSEHVRCIQISVCEALGVERRAAYFDQAGILRDIVQNHVLQMLALICSEPPLSLQDANSIRDEKVKVLRALKRIDRTSAAGGVVRGQYSAGWINGQPVCGYREEQGVAPESNTETYVAMDLEVQNWRWAGVPIFVRAGKRLPKRVTEIAIVFKKAPGFLFSDAQTQHNVLAIQVQPDESIRLRMGAKAPGMRMRIRDVELDFSYAPWFGKSSPEAYERLLLDAMNGDSTLFARNDEIEQAWEFLEPVMSSWRCSDAPPLLSYAAGSWGPDAAADLLKQRGLSWRML